MTCKQTLLEELSTIIENKGSTDNIIVPKTISKKYIEYILSINKVDNIKIFYMEEFVFYTNNVDGYNLIQEDKFFLEEILESTDSIFNKQNLYNETDNILDLLNILFLDNNIYINNEKNSYEDIINNLDINLLSFESQIFLEILKSWLYKSYTEKTYINEYISLLNDDNSSNDSKVHLICYEGMYDLEKKWLSNKFKNICYLENKKINKSEIDDYISNFQSFDFDKQEDELSFLSSDIIKTLESNEHTSIALINNDRYFARRLRAILDRNNISINDKDGWLLSTSTFCSYVNNIINYFIINNNYINLYDIVMSPYFRPNISRINKLELLKNIRNFYKNNIDVSLDLYFEQRKSTDKNLITEFFNKKKDSIEENLCTFQEFKDFIINKISLFESKNFIQSDKAGSQFINVLNQMDRYYKITKKTYMPIVWHKKLIEKLENTTFTQENKSNIYFLDIAHASLYKFDKIYISSMSNTNFPKKKINNFSKNNVIKKDFSLNSNIENIEDIESFIGLDKNSNSITLSFHRSNYSETLTKSKFKVYVDHFTKNYKDYKSKNSIILPNNTNKKIILELNNKYKRLTYRDIENYLECFYCFHKGLNSPYCKNEFDLNNSSLIFGQYVHSVLACLFTESNKIGGYDDILHSLKSLSNDKIKIFYHQDKTSYELQLWEKFLPKIADYFYCENSFKSNFQSEKKHEYDYNDDIKLVARYDLKYILNKQEYIVDYKTGYVDTKSDVINGYSLQLPFYSLISSKVDNFEYLSINVSKNTIKSTLFNSTELNASKLLITKCLDEIYSRIKTKNNLMVKKSISGCDVCGYIDINR